MKTNRLIALLVLVLSSFNSQMTALFAQGTAFTYQGRLNDGASAANGSYDLQFAVFDAAASGVQQGNSITNSATAVSNGLFTITLDFGAGVFSGDNRWLEIGMRSNLAGAFTTLSPRQLLTSTPYAVHARQATGLTGPLPSTQLSGTYSNVVNFNNLENSFSGNGAGLTNLTVPHPSFTARINGLPSGASTLYGAISGISTAAASRGQAEMLSPSTDVTISRMQVVLTTVSLFSGSRTITLYINGNPTAHQCIISGALLGATSSTPVSVPSGSYLSIRVEATGNPNSADLLVTLSY